MKKHYINIYSNCVLSKGYNRSIICDLQFSEYEYISNDLYDILEKSKYYSLEEIYNTIDTKNHKIVNEYIDFLVNKNYINISEKRILQTDNNNTNTNKKEVFTNAIIEIGENTDNDLFSKTIDFLSELGVWAVQIIIKKTKNKKKYFNIINNSIFRHIEIITNKSTYLSINSLFDNRIHKVSIYECSKYDNIKSELYYITTTTDNLSEIKHKCGRVDLCKFHANIYFYNDYLIGNTCLYGKICINELGEIKRCLFSEEIYGNVRDKENLIRDPLFFKMASIRKDEIDICKDCEHRIMCMDCRLHIKDKENKYSAPKYCNYNPYNSKWDS